MSGRRFALESWGERVNLTLGATPREDGTKFDDETFVRVQGLLSELAEPEIWSALREIHGELTGERLPREFDPFHVDGEIVRERLQDSLRLGVATGLLEVQPVAKPRVFIPLEPEVPVAPEMAPQRVVEDSTGDFQARFLDHTGEPIANLDVTLSLFGKPIAGKTNGQGIVTFERFTNGFASLKVKADKLAEALEPVWAKGLPNQRFEGVFHELRFRDELPDVQLELGVERVVIVRPEMGQIRLRLRDKSGRFAHAFSSYRITGPLSFEGETDENGSLFHEDVPPGDYELTFTQTFDEELKLDAVDHTTQIVVLGSGQSGSQERWLGAVPHVRLARLRSMVFETNKTFLLPTAIRSMSRIRDEYERNNPAHLLIVGHTDTSGGDAGNDKLSKARADAVHQYLVDDVDSWLKNYDQGGAGKWGAREDRLMMTQLEGFAFKPPAESHVLWYQKHHNQRAEAKGRPKLKEDGIVGPKTRGEIVRDYMALDGATLSEQAGYFIEVTTHGCGENFPLDATGNEVDARLVSERDGERDIVDRRVELYFFDEEYGVTPKPTGPKGEEYLVWRRRAETFQDDDVAAEKNKATVIRLGDGHFQTGSAVLLPEGGGSVNGGPAKDAPFSLAMALRFNEERPGQSLLFGGHADSVGADKSNDQLSEKRGELSHALLTGNRDKFAEIAQETGKVSDWKKILDWSSRTFADLEPPPDAPAPAHSFSEVQVGAIDDNATTGKKPLEAFQRAYNANKPALGAHADDLKVDGSMGKKSWGAIFDLYQFKMADELGEVDSEEDEADPKKKLEGLGKLRALVSFLPTSKPFLAFGEKIPVDGIGKDNVASAANRRVEMLFFESGHEPDVGVLNEAPDVSELYSPDAYERAEVQADSAKEGTFSPPFEVHFQEPRAALLANEVVELRSSNGSYKQSKRGAEAVRTGEKTLTMRFENAPRKRSYTLTHSSGGTAIRVLENVRLLDKPPAPRASPPEEWSSQLEPIPFPEADASGDESVQCTEVDRPVRIEDVR